VRGVDIRLGPAGPAAALVAGMPPAVLADIGRRALAAKDGGRSVIEGEGRGQRAWTVIVQVADRVRQAPIAQMMMVTIVAGIGQTGSEGRGGQQGGSNQKLRFGHVDSPESSRKL